MRADLERHTTDPLITDPLTHERGYGFGRTGSRTAIRQESCSALRYPNGSGLRRTLNNNVFGWAKECQSSLPNFRAKLAIVLSDNPVALAGGVFKFLAIYDLHGTTGVLDDLPLLQNTSCQTYGRPICP